MIIRTIAIGLLIVLAFFSIGIGQAFLSLVKYTYSPGEQISLMFKAPSGLPNDAWVGIIPSNIQHGSEATNDLNDIAYQYLSGKTEGTLNFMAPSTPGSYDFRLNDTDSNGKELYSVSFTVAASTSKITQNTKAKTTKETTRKNTTEEKGCCCHDPSCGVDGLIIRCYITTFQECKHKCNMSFNKNCSNTDCCKDIDNRPFSEGVENDLYY